MTERSIRWNSVSLEGRLYQAKYLQKHRKEKKIDSYFNTFVFSSTLVCVNNTQEALSGSYGSSKRNVSRNNAKNAKIFSFIICKLFREISHFYAKINEAKIGKRKRNFDIQHLLLIPIYNTYYLYQYTTPIPDLYRYTTPITYTNIQHLLLIPIYNA